MSERMDRKKAEKRTAILDAAERLIVKKGHRMMTMDDVAKEADVAKGTIYLYFKSKESLCAAVTVRCFNMLKPLISRRIAGCESGSERVTASGTVVVEFSMRYPDKWKAMNDLRSLEYHGLEDTNVQGLISLDDLQLQMMADAYSDAIEEGVLRPDVDPLPTAIFLREALLNAISPSSMQEVEMARHGISKERYFRVARDLIIHSTHLRIDKIDPAVKKLLEKKESVRSTARAARKGQKAS